MFSRVSRLRVVRRLNQLNQAAGFARMTMFSRVSRLRVVRRLNQLNQAAGFARKRGGGGRRGSKGGLIDSSRTTPAALNVEEVWVEVKEEGSGQIYWWNTETDETTELGAPKPTGMYAPVTDVGQASAPGFMGMVAQGFALGTGASLASHAIHGIFGGGDGGGGGDAGGADQMGGGGGGGFDSQDQNDDGSWDV